MPDQDQWAEALMVNRIHGERAPLHIAEQIAAVTRAGDAAGVARLEEIGARLDQLARPEVVQ